MTLATAVYLHTQRTDLAVGIHWLTDVQAVLSDAVVFKQHASIRKVQTAVVLKMYVDKARNRMKAIAKEATSGGDKAKLLDEAIKLQDRSSLAIEMLELLDD